MDVYSILVGPGTLYAANESTACPDVDDVPGASWTNLGEFKDDLKVTLDQSITLHRTKNRTGPVKATRSEEGITFEAVLAEATLENLAKVMNGLTVSDTAAIVGTIGTRKLKLHRGADVTEFALLWRGNSPYGDFPAQYYIPRGFFDGATALDQKQADYVGIPVKFVALEDLDAATEEERFGYYEAEDAAALSA